MSKIQKALNALKQTQNRPGEIGILDGDVSSENTVRPPSRRVRKRASSGKSDYDNREMPFFDRSNETIPKDHIEIQPKELEASGLSPGPEDLDIINQQFRRIKRPIIQAAFEVDLPTGENANTIMMASALPGAGKSFCAFNLSQSISLERDIGAVLVDADVLKPGISRSLGLQDHIGLIDYLMDSTVQLEDVLVQTNLNGLIVIPAGRKHAESTELLASRRMGDFVSLLSQQFRNRVVVFDMPPLLLTSEAQVLAAKAGQIVIVIEARVSSQESVIRALGLLDRQKPINAILNKSRSAASGGYHSDDYGYYPYPAAAYGNEE